MCHNVWHDVVDHLSNYHPMKIVVQEYRGLRRREFLRIVSDKTDLIIGQLKRTKVAAVTLAAKDSQR
jgi:hypothetical protein